MNDDECVHRLSLSLSSSAVIPDHPPFFSRDILPPISTTELRVVPARYNIPSPPVIPLMPFLINRFLIRQMHRNNHETLFLLRFRVEIAGHEVAEALVVADPQALLRHKGRAHQEPQLFVRLALRAEVAG